MKAHSSEGANADGTVGIKAEDRVEGVDHRRGCCDDGPADDGHLALVHVSTADGKATIDDGGDAEDEAEHHDDGQAVADAGFQVSGTKSCALSRGGDGVKG